MTPCDTIREQIQFYLEGGLSAQESAAVEAHLADCEVCRAVADDTRLLLAALATPGIPRAPVRLKGAITARVALARRRRKMLQTVSLAAALLVGIGIALVTGWAGVDDGLLAELADWQFDDVWQSATGAVEALGTEVTQAEVAWPSSLTSGPTLAVLALAFVAVDVLLLLRWRGLAVSGTEKARTIR